MFLKKSFSVKLFERKSWSQDITCSSSTFAQNNSLKLKVCLYRKVKLYYHFTIKTLYYFYYFFLFCFVLFLCCCCFDHLYHHYSHLQSSHSQILYKIGVFKNLARKTLAQVFSYEFCKIFKDIFLQAISWLLHICSKKNRLCICFSKI